MKYAVIHETEWNYMPGYLFTPKVTIVEVESIKSLELFRFDVLVGDQIYDTEQEAIDVRDHLIRIFREGIYEWIARIVLTVLAFIASIIVFAIC